MFVDFLDELGSGIGPVSAADLRDEFGLAYSSLALMLLVAPLLLSFVVEGPLLLLSDGWQRERVAAWSVAGMGACMLAASSANSPWTLALWLGAWGSLSGLGCGVSQGALMSAHPEARERWMTRWTLMGELGDAATPLLIIAATALGFGWRGALAGAGVLHLLHAIVLSRVRLGTADDSSDDDDDEPEDQRSIWVRLREGLRDRRLLGWLLAAALCCLLDEILVAFGAMFLRDELGASLEVQSFAFVLASIGGAIGLVISDLLLRHVDARRLLMFCALLTAIVFGIWTRVHTLSLSLALLGLLGLVAAPVYPICAARAYAARPDQAGVVAAIDQLFAPIALLAPLAIGALADQFGIVTALTALLLEPIGVLLIALVIERSTRT